MSDFLRDLNHNRHKSTQEHLPANTKNALLNAPFLSMKFELKHSPMKIAGLLFFFITCFLLSCHEVPDGGPCTYKITKTPATVIAIQQQDSLYSEILFLVPNGEFSDTLYYTRNFSGFASKADIAKYDLKVGNDFTYEEHQIESGHCSPHYFVLKLEKFRK